jgi:hypothetical protein
LQKELKQCEADYQAAQAQKLNDEHHLKEFETKIGIFKENI